MAVILQVEVQYMEILHQICPEEEEAALRPSAVTTPGEEALARWMAQIRASIGEIDHGGHHGFRLGDAIGDADMSIPVIRFFNHKNPIRELQWERARSCSAVVCDSSLEAENADALSKQRHIVDGVFVELLELTDAPIMRDILSSLVLLRSVVDNHAANNKGLSWEERYRIICADPRSFNSLIGTLIEWMCSACKISHAIDEASAETIRLFCYFSEQLGRERAFVLCRGNASRISNEGTDGMRSLALMSVTRTLIGDLLQINSDAFRNFETRCLYGDIEDGTDWFETISPCIDACHDLVGKLLDQADDDIGHRAKASFSL
jgi:hypothetical protein